MGSGKSDGFDEVNQRLESGSAHDESEGGLGEWLRSIDRSSLVGQSKGMKAGLGVAAGSGAYLFSPFTVEDTLEYLPFAGERAESEWKSLDNNYLKQNIQNFGEVEGVPEVNTLSGLIDAAPELLENTPELIAYSADNAAHYATNYGAATLGCMAVDKVTGEYDPKKVVLGGMITVPMYVLFKEGWYEGGSGIQFSLEAMDVRGDIAADTLGALHAVYSYHKRKTASEETEPGRLGTVARKAGQAFGRMERRIRDRERDDYNKHDPISADDLEIADLPPGYGERTAEELGIGNDSPELVESEEEVQATD